MAIAGLHETLLTYTWRKNELNLEITRLQSLRTLTLYSTGDRQQLKAAEEEELRNYFRALYDGDEEYQSKYVDYTQIPDFEEELDKIAAKYQEELEQISAWETNQIEAQLTTTSAELEEVNAYIESIKSMLTSNIQDDFDYGLK